MQHLVIPMNDILHLMFNPGDAKIHSDNTYMVCAVEDNLHILVGNFTGVDSAEKLDDIIKQNL